MIVIKPMLPDQWQLHKVVRTAALADAPYAYSTTLETAHKRSDGDWSRLTEQYISNPNSITYFVYNDDVPCGMCACVIAGDAAEMFAVWVDPAHRRKGAGRALIDYACSWSEGKGAVKMKVGVYDDNPQALAFYRSAGFVDRGEINPELSNEERRVLMLARDLGPTASQD